MAADINNATKIVEITSVKDRSQQVSEMEAKDDLIRQTSDVLERINDAFVILDNSWNIVHVNARTCELQQKHPTDIVGASYWEIWPECVGTEVERQFYLAKSSNSNCHFSHHFVVRNKSVWYEFDLYPADLGLYVFYRDISGRVMLLQMLEDATARTSAILESITDSFYTLDHDWRFTYLNAEAERVLGRSREEMLGCNIWDAYPKMIATPFEHHFRRAMAKSTTEHFEEFSPSLQVWLELRIYPSSDGISVFFQNVDQRKHLEAERERLLVAERTRAEREKLLNEMSQSLRALDPEGVQSTAVTLLGRALGADRCYYVTYDYSNRTATVAPDYFCDNLKSIEGKYAFVQEADMYRQVFDNTHISIVADADALSTDDWARVKMQRLGIKSWVSVGLVDADNVTARLTAANVGEAREWSEDDASLVEAVALQLRSATALARVTRREHNIAMKLQGALQPDIPLVVPGLTLAR